MADVNWIALCLGVLALVFHRTIAGELARSRESLGLQSLHKLMPTVVVVAGFTLVLLGLLPLFRNR